MPDTRDEKICPKCQMPYEKAGSGSLTQWILVCTCHLKDEKSNSSEPLNYCSTCGKRIESGRAGTLTQWIFRADLCSCASAEFIRKAQIGFNKSISDVEKGVDQSEFDSIDELKIEGGGFPIDRYAPYRKLGKGSAGSVYLCKDRLLKKRVAVKVLNYLSAEQLVAFQREAKSTSQLSHPNIVKVIDFGISDGAAPYMVLDYIDGINLDSVITTDGPLKLEYALTVFEQLCDALEYAHQRGLMHRDLKPSNIIIVPATASSPAAVHLIDFGVGAFKQEVIDPKDSQRRTVVGTPAYMSPDQAGGNAYDARSEIYSFGCVMFESLTGRLPFEADSPLATISMHAHTPAPALADVIESIDFPESVEKLVATCLSKSPEERFQNIDALKREISDIHAAILKEERLAKGVDSAAPPPAAKSLPVVLILLSGFVTVLIVIVFYRLTSFDDAKTPDDHKVYAVDLDDGYASIDSAKWHRHTTNTGMKAWSSGPALTDDDFKVLAEETDVNSISINVTYNVTGKGFKYLSNLPLYELYIQSSALSDEGLEAISKIKSLRFLSISVGSLITKKGIECLRQLPNLNHFELIVTEIPPGTFDVLSQMHNLTHLSFFDSTNISLKDIAKFSKGNPKLCFLDLSDTGLTDDLIPVVAKLKELQEVRLASLKLTDKHLDLLAQLPKLQRINLAGTGITDFGLEKLSKSRSLKYVEVGRCKEVSHQALKTLNSERRIIFRQSPK